LGAGQFAGSRLELAASSAAGEEQQAFVGMVKDTIAIHRMQEH